MLNLIKDILFVLVAVAVFLLAASFLFSNKYGLYIVSSGSMSPQITAGSVIVNKKNTDYNVGDVITFQRRGNLITHKIVKEINGEYVTKGQANKEVDINPVEKNNVLGKVVLAIPVIGYFLIFAKSPIGILAIIILGGYTVFKEFGKILDCLKKKK